MAQELYRKTEAELRQLYGGGQQPEWSQPPSQSQSQHSHYDNSQVSHYEHSKHATPPLSRTPTGSSPSIMEASQRSTPPTQEVARKPQLGERWPSQEMIPSQEARLCAEHPQVEPGWSQNYSQYSR